jgi:hypothetical protein
MGKGVPRMTQQFFALPGGVLGQGGPARRQIFKQLAESLKGGVGTRIPIVQQGVARVRGTVGGNVVRNA